MTIVQNKEQIKRLSILTKTILIIAGIFIFYGFLCRIFRIQFFWESKFIGWFILLIGIICFLSDRIKFKRTKNIRFKYERIFIYLIIFFIFFQLSFVVIIRYSDVYAATKLFLYESPQIKEQIGDIERVIIRPLGNLAMQGKQIGRRSEMQKSGSATIFLTVKGEKKFIDIIIFADKEFDTSWEFDYFSFSLK